MDEAASPFWTFSTTVYARPAVAQACLALQDGFGLDVNLLLFCLHAGANGRELSAAELAMLDEAVKAWRAEVVQPLRAVRRWLKASAPPAIDEAAELRRRVLGMELAAEQAQQRLMERMLPIAPGPGSAAMAGANLERYAVLVAANAGDALRAALVALESAVSEPPTSRTG